MSGIWDNNVGNSCGTYRRGIPQISSFRPVASGKKFFNLPRVVDIGPRANYGVQSPWQIVQVP